MRTNVTFRHPAEFVGDSEDGGGVLAVEGAAWFAALLRRVPRLEVDKELCQEDWGVVFYVQRGPKKFWIGLSAWDSEGTWIAHFHHRSFAWIQQFTSSGKDAFRSLLTDVHAVLASASEVSEIKWYDEKDVSGPNAVGFPMPFDS